MFKKNSYSDNKGLFKKRFFECETNSWILKKSSILRPIEILLNSMNEEIISFFDKKELAMVSCQGLWAATISPRKNLSVIIIFPNLIDLFLTANYRLGIAVLAHEVGHIFLEHSSRNLDPIDEQYEADLFAAELGFKNDLINFLSLYPDSQECKIRKERLLKEVKRLHSIP